MSMLILPDFSVKLEEVSILEALDFLSRIGLTFQEPIINRFRQPKAIAMRSVPIGGVFGVSLASCFRNFQVAGPKILVCLSA